MALKKVEEHLSGFKEFYLRMQLQLTLFDQITSNMLRGSVPQHPHPVSLYTVKTPWKCSLCPKSAGKANFCLFPDLRQVLAITA